MSVADRIKIVEAMGYVRVDNPHSNMNYQCWQLNPDGENYGYILSDQQLPDPFTNANDDYAVLLHYRNRAELHPEEWQAFKDYFLEVRNDWNIWNYEKGLFAHAALKVIDNANYDDCRDMPG